MTEGRRHDPRRLSRTRPGRSEIQDAPPRLPPTLAANDNRETVGDYRRTQGLKHPPLSARSLRKRALRARGAMPPGSDRRP